MPNVGSSALEGAVNPFDRAAAISSSINIVAAPAPSGGDDYTTLQALIDAYSPLGITIVPANAEYLLSAELSIPATAHGEILRGVPGKYDVAQGTRFKLTGAARSCFATTNVYNVQISGIKFDSNRFGTYPAYLNGLTWSKFEDCVFENALLDGLFLAVGPNLQDSNRFINCTFYFNGQTYASAGCIAQYTHGIRTLKAGLATTVAGNAVINFVGAPDFTALLANGTPTIRKGDFLRVGPTLTGQIMQIESVAATSITVQGNANNLPTISAAGQDWAIGSGDGIHEVRQSNNNLNLFEMCTTRGHGGSGFRFNGLYGPTVIGGQADFNNFFAAAIGESDNANVMFTGSIDHLYVEGNDTADFFLGQALDLDIRSINGASEPMIAGARLATGTINGEDIQYGKDQSFIIQLTRTGGGILQHRIVSDLIVGSGGAASDRVSGASIAYANTPALDAVTGFASGAGTFGGTLILDTAAQGDAPFGELVFESNTTGAAVRASLSVSNVNINGVTLKRTTLRLIDGTGAEVSWAATIAIGQTLAVRANIRIR